MQFLRFAFANTVLHKRATLLVFYAEYTKKCHRNFLYPGVTKGQPWLDQEKKYYFKTGFLQIRPFSCCRSIT